ncbi:MAG TPA: N-acyl homoserine lactonase family protein [Burkholderiaceae bacterium]|nr:N-acyl homoserine lactonase family protein [Burkholderiaceae bacterium]
MMPREIAAAGRAARALSLILLASSLLAGCAQSPSPRAGSGGVERLYVLDCGEARIPDLSPWSPGVNVGTAATFSDNCYLIRHAQGWMLWDSGYPDALADKPEGLVGPRSTAFRKKTLVAQMAQIGVTPAQVTRVAFSHTHGDHVGNANLFSAATLYIQQAEYDAAFGPDPAKFGFQPANYDKLRNSTAVKLNGDHDVFGDGSVVILATAGHTPGHQSLLVRLPHTGAVVLSGDAAHFRENFERRRVPGFNFDRDASVAAMDKLAAVVQKEKAQLWINHDSAQSATLRHAPEFYD